MDYLTAVEVLVTAFAAFGLVAVAKWAEYRAWRRSLVAFRVRLPDGVETAEIARALGVVAGSTRRGPVVIETVGTSRGIAHFLVVAEQMAPRVVSLLTATVPGVRLDEVDGYLSARPGVRFARELVVARSWRPLASERGAQASAGVLAALYPLAAGEAVTVQWTLRARQHVRLRGDVPPDMARDFQIKQSTPLMEACGRVAVRAPHKARALLLLSGVLDGLAVLDTAGAGFSVRPLPWRVVAHRVRRRAVPLLRWPCLLNAVEAAGVLALPVDGLTVPGVTTGAARALPVPPEMRGHGVTLARSNYPGMDGRPISLATGDRLRHTYVLGPTGTGKSELLANMAVQDIRAGRSVVVIDPKSDLVSEVLARVPDSRSDDVVLLDASATDSPVGFNPLHHNGEHSRELVVDRTVHVFSQLWRRSWGPRTADVLRNGLLTLTAARAADGSHFTLAELPDLLTDPDFRYAVLRSKGILGPVRQFWDFYENVSDAERMQMIGPAMNKLRAFTTRTALRLVIGQSAGFDLGTVFRQKRILLVPLSKGVIGPDAAQLLGSLLVASLWQETLNRAATAPEKRAPVFAYIDEFQEFLNFGAGDAIGEMLAQARSFGLGLVLANQYLDQLSSDVAQAVLGTVRSQIVFQTEYGDAHTMARRFAPLETSDLSGLDTYEVALRPCVNSRTLSPVTGRTLQLPDPERAPSDLARHSLDRYGTPRAQVETQRRLRTQVTPPTSPNGRSGGRQDMGSEAL